MDEKGQALQQEGWCIDVYVYVCMNMEVKGQPQLLFLRSHPLNFSDWLASESQAFPFLPPQCWDYRYIQLDHFLLSHVDLGTNPHAHTSDASPSH